LIAVLPAVALVNNCEPSPDSARNTAAVTVTAERAAANAGTRQPTTIQNGITLEQKTTNQTCPSVTEPKVLVIEDDIEGAALRDQKNVFIRTRPDEGNRVAMNLMNIIQRINRSGGWQVGSSPGRANNSVPQILFDPKTKITTQPNGYVGKNLQNRDIFYNDVKFPPRVTGWLVCKNLDGSVYQ
jgi:hypothetical protein